MRFSVGLLTTAVLLILPVSGIALQNSPVPPLDPAHDHIRGSKEARVTMIVYADLSSPAVSSLEKTYLVKLRDEYAGRLALAYRPYPLPGIHRFAIAQAEAMECMFELGTPRQAWGFYDKLMHSLPLNPINAANLGNVAKSLRVDIRSCMTSDRYLPRIEAAQQAGIAAGISGVPTVFLAGPDGKISESLPLDSLDSIHSRIDLLLKAAAKQ